jgi:hypothetical protein
VRGALKRPEALTLLVLFFANLTHFVEQATTLRGDEFETDLRIAHRRSYRRCGSSEPKPAGNGRKPLRRHEAKRRFPFSQGGPANLKIPM